MAEPRFREPAAPLQARRLSEWEVEEGPLVATELRDCELRGVDAANRIVRRGSLARVMITDCRLTGTAWADARIEDAVFRDSRLDLASFGGATLRSVVFADVDLREADFADAWLDFVRFERCDLSGASFRGARFTLGELRACTLDGLVGVEGLRGTSLPWPELVSLAGPMAAALGIGVLDAD